MWPAAARGVAFVLLAALAPARPAGASGPYIVDDASITPARRAQIEAWLSAMRGDRIANIIPAANFGGVPVEWSVALTGARQAGQQARAVTAQAKWRVRETGERRVGVALAANASADPATGRVSSAVVYAAVTVPLRADLLIHGNVGDNRGFGRGGRDAFTWGVRGEYAAVAARLAVHAELFGSAATGTGSQLGLPPTLARGTLDLELVVSRNLTGERGTWLTLGTAVRF